MLQIHGCLHVARVNSLSEVVGRRVRRVGDRWSHCTARAFVLFINNPPAKFFKTWHVHIQKYQRRTFRNRKERLGGLVQDMIQPPCGGGLKLAQRFTVKRENRI